VFFVFQFGIVYGFVIDKFMFLNGCLLCCDVREQVAVEEGDLRLRLRANDLRSRIATGLVTFFDDDEDEETAGENEEQAGDKEMPAAKATSSTKRTKMEAEKSSRDVLQTIAEDVVLVRR
jgi:hypothetical protein